MAHGEKPTPAGAAGGEGRLEALARQAAAGDRNAQRELLEALAPRLLGVVRAVIGAGAPEVEDVAQESLIAFLDALPGFRGECSVYHYGSRIAARIAIATRRRQREREDRRQAFERESIPFGASSGPEALASLRRELLRDLLAELPEAQAEALALRAVMGCTIQEVADTTGAPRNTVRSRLRLAKEALRRRIEADARLAEILEVPE